VHGNDENTVLLIKELPEQLEATGIQLRQSGYRVLTATDGWQGLEVAKREHPDLIVSDVVMQQMDGIELCHLIREHYELCSIPVLLLSSKDGESVAQGLNAGANDFLEVPYDPMRFIAKVAQLVERKRIEEASSARQARLSVIGDSAMDAIITVDGNHRIVLFNRAAESMFRCRAPQAIGHRLDRFIPEGFESIRAPHTQNFDQPHIPNPPMGALYEIIGLRADGKEFPIEASISELTSQGKQFLTIILRDITERRQAEEKVRRLNAELERRITDLTAQLQAANKEFEAFCYSVLHGLRAHLDTTGATRGLVQLISDLSRIASVMESEMRRERVYLDALADKIVIGLKESDPERKVTVRIEKGLWADGDQYLLAIMLESLMANAWKFTSGRERAEIEFGKQNHNGKIVYFIRDNGAGFDMTNADRLFVPFQRLHNNGEFKGTGIGLATVQRIVHRHGGRVWAKGATGEGATFYFTLQGS